MSKNEHSNEAHNLQHVNKLFNDILHFHSQIYETPRKETVTFDEALAVLKRFEATVVEIFESPERLICQKCESEK